jgi:6-phosphogluconolactonase
MMFRRALDGLVIVGALLQVVAVAAPAPVTSDSFRVYIGTYTGPRSQGIYTARFDTATGALSRPELAAAVKNPTFLALHPNHQHLYAVEEVDKFKGERSGAVSAFRIEPASGKLALLDEQPSGGAGPCHLSVDKTGHCVLVANYNSGSIAALPLLDGGKLGPPAMSIQHHGSGLNPNRQAGPHAHFILPDPSNRLVLNCDLGLDKVMLYHLDPIGAALTANDPPAFSVTPGSGPRHLAFAPDGKMVYLINELGSSVDVFDYDAARGTLKEIQTLSTLPETFKGQNIAAEVQVAPSGGFVYASNRGDDSLVVFKVDPVTGRLTFVERTPAQGKTPRHFALVPGGRWLVAENQDSDNIVVFRVDAETGRLTFTGQTVPLGSPVCIVFLPVGSVGRP